LHPFDLGVYAKAELATKISCKGLVALFDLLSALLQCCPGGIINHVPLASALLQCAQADETLKAKALSAESWADLMAHKIRVALAHLRKVKQQPLLFKRRSAELGADSDLEPPEPEQAEPDGAEPAPAMTSPAKPSTSALAVDFSPFLQSPPHKKHRAMSAAAKAPPASPRPEGVRLTPAKVGLLLDAFSDKARPAAVQAQRKQVRQARAGLDSDVAKPNLVLKRPAGTGRRAKLPKAEPLEQEANLAEPTCKDEHTCKDEPSSSEDHWEPLPSKPAPSSSAADAETQHDDTAKPRQFCKMWYKRGDAWGIRAKGGRQQLQVRACNGLTKKEAGLLADDCIALLEGGEDLPAVKAWLHLQYSKAARATQALVLRLQKALADDVQ
jgi:hypothetical protein